MASNWYPELLAAKCAAYDPRAKPRNTRTYTEYMLNRVASMIDYDGLPETIPKRDLLLMLQINGNVFIPKKEFTGGNYYAFTGGLGGEPDIYYHPTLYTIANPALSRMPGQKGSMILRIDVDGALIRHDSMLIGLLPLMLPHASLLVETDLTMRMAIKNARTIAVLSAPDDRTKQAAEKYLADLEDGKDGVIGETAFLDGIKVQPIANEASRTLTQLIEMRQYLKASWYNDLGLSANYNMKRESINSDEAQLDNDALLPLVDDILSTQKTCFERLADITDGDLVITPKLGSAWQDRQEATEAELKPDEAESIPAKSDEQEEE